MMKTSAAVNPRHVKILNFYYLYGFFAFKIHFKSSSERHPVQKRPTVRSAEIKDSRDFK